MEEAVIAWAVTIPAGARRELVEGHSYDDDLTSAERLIAKAVDFHREVFEAYNLRCQAQDLVP